MSPAAQNTRYSVANLRRGVWHLRHGGIQGYRKWAHRRVVTVGPTVAGQLRRDGTLTFAPWPLPDRAPGRPDLRVGVILDDFSKLAFGYEWDQVELAPSSWRETLEAEPVDLVFVESAWAGNGGAWKYHLTGTSAPRPAIVELLAWCTEHGVPTVFWNKEDPAHFEDFLDVARLFDHVFTSDENRLPAYREALGHDRVGTLSFAAQPAIHNPVRSGAGHQLRDVAFAGMYFAHRFPERREQMDLLLGAALRASSRMEIGLEIFSRQLGGEQRYQFPAPFDARVVGSLNYPQMLSAYRAYKVFLNVNSVTGSPSMCARRIFEITASGTPVLTTPSVAVDRFFTAAEVPQVATPDDAEFTVRALVRSPELRDRMVHLAQRKIWSEHTYGHRVDQVLGAAGVTSVPARRRPTVSALVSTNRPGQLDHVLRTVAAQVEIAPELVLLTHGFTVPDGELRAKARALGIEHLVLLTADPTVPLGECLNRLVKASSGDLVAKMDDDDLYGAHYLSDQAYVFDYSGAAVVGKQAHYVRLEAVDATLLRFAEREHKFTDFVMGPTIVAGRALALEIPFPPVFRGEDTGFLRAALDAEAKVYSADRFNFVQVRQSETTDHTWSISDAELLASGTLHVFGTSTAHTMF